MFGKFTSFYFCVNRIALTRPTSQPCPAQECFYLKVRIIWLVWVRLQYRSDKMGVRRIPPLSCWGATCSRANFSVVPLPYTLRKLCCQVRFQINWNLFLKSTFTDGLYLMPHCLFFQILYFYCSFDWPQLLLLLYSNTKNNDNCCGRFAPGFLTLS